MCTNNKILRALSLITTFMALVIAISPAIALEQNSQSGIEVNEDEWKVYTDPRFDFTVEYPPSWSIHLRDDTPNYVGATLIFSEMVSHSSLDCGKPFYAKIEIGLYLAEYDETSLTVSGWSEKYDKTAQNEIYLPGEVQNLSARELTIGDNEAYYKQGSSPLTSFSYINIPYEKTMWFIWTNSVNSEYVTILEHVASTLKFGENTPTTLKEAYGQDFRPMPLENKVLIEREELNGSLGQVQHWLLPLLAPDGYRVPFDSPTRYIKCGNINSSLCGGTHSGSAAKAIDISASVGTSVKNSVASYTNWVGWDSSGYGNLVKMRHSSTNNRIFYAHLSVFNVANLYPGGEPPPWPEPVIPQSIEIAKSGQSGAPGMAAHLHFHVQTSGGSAVDLAGMPNLTLNSGATDGYPHCGKSTCPNPPSFDCTCGRLY